MTFTSQLPSARRDPASARVRLAPALRAYQYNLLAYKRTWRGSVTTTFLYPVLYLAAIGVGLGHLIDHGSSQAVDGVRYICVPRSRAAWPARPCRSRRTSRPSRSWRASSG